MHIETLSHRANAGIIQPQSCAEVFNTTSIIKINVKNANSNKLHRHFTVEMQNALVNPRLT